jgi:DNA-binding transcriptional ArsR family regulator
MPRPYPDVRVVTGPAFELIAELAAFTSGPVRGDLDSGKTWIREVRKLAGPELVGRVERYALSIYAELSTIAIEAASPRGLDELVGRIESMDPSAFRRRLLGADSAMSRSMVSDGAIDRAIRGDTAARAEVRSTFGIDRHARQALDRVLDASPVALRDELVAILTDWAGRVFPRFAPEALAAIARDAGAREAELARAGSGAAVVTGATRGVAYDPPAWIRSIVLVPTVALRPFIIPAELAETAVFICSVADDSLGLDPAAPPHHLVKVAAALGDERRLRVLHVLRDGELTASEIAERLGVDRTSLHHHLGILRSAGLLAISDDGVGGWRYALRAGGWADIGNALESYLRPPSG